MKRDAIAIKPKDNVATAIRDLSAGERIQVGLGEDLVALPLIQDIPHGHKLALRAIKSGDDIIKYAAVIGRATQAIEPGAHVHVHNVESLRGRGDLAQTQCKRCSQ